MDTLSCCDMALKLYGYFYLLIESPPGCHFHVWSPYNVPNNVINLLCIVYAFIETLTFFKCMKNVKGEHKTRSA